jgi:hypothetical protein
MMPHIDPTVRFWIGIVITVAIGISSGSLALKGAVPPEWIPYVTAWAAIIAFIGSALLTALNGAAMTTSSRIASAAAVDGVKGFDVDSKIKAIAVDAAGTNATVTTT